MTYQVLARKWRPQDFSSVIGQDNIVTALRNALSEKRIAQAYLFSGIRGVGKTSVARVLAKALNCEKGPASDPCNECQTCREITSGSDLDVIEVDAATYSKVEQIRELTESLKYGPARDRYKVVVIDEIHRLSRQAFDALLKIVEEPPPHLVFVGSGEISDEDAANVLGGVDRSVHHRLLAAILGGGAGDIAEIVSEIESRGWDPRHVFAEFLAYCRDALHLSLGVEAESVELPHDETERLAELAKETGYENLLRLLHQLLGSEAIVRRSDSGTLAVEIAWLRAAELPKLTKIEALLAAGPTSSESTPSDSTNSGARTKSRSGSKAKKADEGSSAVSKAQSARTEPATTLGRASTATGAQAAEEGL
ncbi:MAG: DNA polymerase III subunit gamma/tau, partial [Acidobacteriota bacterium]